MIVYLFIERKNKAKLEVTTNKKKSKNKVKTTVNKMQQDF